jgi:hypothetical protein
MVMKTAGLLVAISVVGVAIFGIACRIKRFDMFEDPFVVEQFAPNLSVQAAL